MPRPPRIDLPDIPQHVLQRGDGRQPCFFIEADYLCYRTLLREAALREGCAVHAYVLMTNHMHLLLTPQQPHTISRTLQSLGRRYVRYINDRYHRSGTLREGRHKACPVDRGDYVMHCHRHIELNPLRAAMVANPHQYCWSSHHALAYGDVDPLVHPHPTYLALDTNPATRESACRKMAMATVNLDDIDVIRRHLPTSADICDANTPMGAVASSRPSKHNSGEVWVRRRSAGRKLSKWISARPKNRLDSALTNLGKILSSPSSVFWKREPQIRLRGQPNGKCNRPNSAFCYYFLARDLLRISLKSRGLPFTAYSTPIRRASASISSRSCTEYTITREDPYPTFRAVRARYRPGN